MRLLLTVEGQTEQTFAVGILQPHLAAYNVFVSNPRLTGTRKRRKKRIPQGGMNKFQHPLEDIRKWMKEDQAPDARFSMMVDLYSLPTDFPGYDNAMALTDPYRQAYVLEKALAKELGDPRFIPYVQVHEFEALVLSKPEVFGDLFENAQRKVDALKVECSAFNSPELIDHGMDTHPKARIKKHFRDYDENVDGPELAKIIGLAAIREKCPHFDQWLKILERLDAVA